MISSVADTKVVESMAGYVFRGLLACAKNDGEISTLISGEYSADIRRRIPADELVLELSGYIYKHVEKHPYTKSGFCEAVGLDGMSVDFPNCLWSVVIAAEYLNSLEVIGEFRNGIKYNGICRMSSDFNVETLSNSYAGERIDRISLDDIGNADETYYSTMQNIVSERPQFPLGNVCGIYEREPIMGNGCDGGLRTMGIYKKDSDELPLITYITAVYNREDVLWRCMESIFSQDYPNIEYIVVDGASTDGTLDLIKRYGDKIDYYVSQPDTGLYNAMNRGIKLASGRFICFMNSDDNCTPGAAAKVARVHRETGADVVSGQRNTRNADGRINSGEGFKRFHLKNCALVYTFMYHQSLYDSRRVFEEIGYFDESYRICSDYIHGSKILSQSSFKTVFTEDKLCVFASTGVSNTKRDVMAEEFARYTCETFSYVTMEDAEKFYYGLRCYDFPPYHYCDFKTLTKIAEKYFIYPEFKRAYYEAMMYSCYTWYFMWLRGKQINLRLTSQMASLFDGYPIQDTKEIFDSMVVILENHCRSDCVSVSDSEIESLCSFQRSLHLASQKLEYLKQNSFYGKLKIRAHLFSAKFIARSNMLTFRSIKRYIQY